MVVGGGVTTTDCGGRRSGCSRVLVTVAACHGQARVHARVCDCGCLRREKEGGRGDGQQPQLAHPCPQQLELQRCSVLPRWHRVQPPCFPGASPAHCGLCGCQRQRRGVMALAAAGHALLGAMRWRGTVEEKVGTEGGRDGVERRQAGGIGGDAEMDLRARARMGGSKREAGRLEGRHMGEVVA